jgi:tetratricopeptide (TPR) repeat protein
VHNPAANDDVTRYEGPEQRVADIFISYTSSDRDWAFWIAKELEALGHTPRIHEWEIKGGDDIHAWMEQRHDAADHVLCVVSDEYLEAPYSTLERNAAIWQAAANRPGFVLFVAVKPCRFPTLIDHYRRCQLYGISDDEARERFRAFMQQPADAAPVAFPGEAFAVSNVPIRVPEHFLGREDSLAAIEAALGRYEGRVAITALHGLRGVGKTTLAAAYAERHRGDYRATWWIRAQAEATMRADLVGLGVRLKWVPADEKEEPALSAVMDRLRLEGGGILLIYDNAIDAEALRPYLPRGGAARVLVTSNAHTWRGVAQPVEIRLWPKEIGADYLIARTGRIGERVAAAALSEMLGGLPLAHEQAAAYCERLNVAMAEYAKRFAATPERLLDDTRDAPAEYHDGLTVAKTFGLAIEEAAKLHPAAEPLIVHAALLAPEPIPLFLFAEAREKLGEPLATALADDGLDEAVAALRAFALVDAETIPDERDAAVTTDCIRLHRLVRQVAAARRDGVMRDDVQRALIKAVAAVYPESVYDDPQTWPRARRLDALALALAGGDAVATDGEESAASLLDSAGLHRYSALAAYAQARPLVERALAIREKVLGPEHSATATSLNSLALLLHDQGDPAAARPLYERALAIREKVLGPEHPDTATSLSNLARLLETQGDLAAARPLFERALAIGEKVFGPDHPETATTLNNLATLLRVQGDLAAARPLYERALAIDEKVLGPEHPNTAASLNNLAVLLRAQGDLAAARPLFERALAIDEKVFGPDHPETATTLNNLAWLLRTQSELAARPLLERVLAIREKVLGPEHPATAMSLNNLASLLHDQGDPAGARPLFERALAIDEKVFGPEHLVTAETLSNLGFLLQAQGDFAARQLCERVLAIREKALGAEHPMTAASLHNLAFLLHAEGDLAAAQPLYERALAIGERVLGPEHPNTATCLNNLGRLLCDLGQTDEAEPLFRRAIASGEKALGPDHPDTQRYQRQYARLLLMTDRAAEAFRVGETALTTHARVNGPNHPSTKDSARVTADALDALGRGDEAKALRARYAVEPKSS